MKTFKGDLHGHSGCACNVIITGEDIPEAIRDWAKRKHSATVISITEPYKAGEYHVEHTGRDLTTYQFGEPGKETIFFDQFSNLKEIKSL
uniref:Uncharacterized protein n=1 Tax=viral metagenome TaxID=1070528 RepID=A0A6M3LHM3_9ZZZZ